MSARVETPPSLHGEIGQQISQLNSYLFRLAEGLNVELDRMTGTENPSPAAGGAVMSVREYRELRDMIGTSAKDLTQMMDKKIPAEVTTQLRIAEQSGDFDGNGIASTSFNDDYSITFGYTDGTFFKTPPIKGDKGDRGENFQFEVGDVFLTTREGDAAELLGYGVWELLTDSPASMWKRTE